jgi:hypothetical protein
MLPFPSAVRDGERRTDTHGTFEHNPTSGFARDVVDLRDFEPQGFVAPYDKPNLENPRVAGSIPALGTT